MATYTLAPNVKRQFLDNSGNPLASGKLYTYLAGTSTAATTYQTSSGTAHANPIVLDSAGRISGSSELYFDTSLSYKLTLKTSADVEVWTQDNIAAVPPSTVNVDIQGLFGVAADAGDLMYLSDGSGALTAGSWYKADSDLTYASVYPELAFAVNATASGATGTLRKDGQITLTGPLTPGDAYYVSGTAGAVTTTAPANNLRYVGQAQSTTVLAISVSPQMETIATFADVKHVCNGRLTLTTATPVTTADVTAAATLYFTPYQGNQIGLYTGSAWFPYVFSELSIAAPAAANQMYDVFCDWNDGTPALALLAWTNDTTRATALVLQNGIWVKTGDTQQRYLGSVRTVTASQFNDSVLLRHVWNYYNRVPRPLVKTDVNGSWTYTTATVRQARGDATNQVDVVVGVAEVPIDLVLKVNAVNGTANSFAVGIGEDSTTTFADGVWHRINGVATMVARLVKYPAVGRHVYSWNEWSEALDTTTWYGSNTNGSAVTSGLRGWIEG